MKPRTAVRKEGPQTSLWKISKTEFDTMEVLFKGYLCILALIPYAQEEKSSSIWDKDTFFITSFKAKYKSLELGCPSL